MEDLLDDEGIGVGVGAIGVSGAGAGAGARLGATTVRVVAGGAHVRVVHRRRAAVGALRAEGRAGGGRAAEEERRGESTARHGRREAAARQY